MPKPSRGEESPLVMRRRLVLIMGDLHSLACRH
jgi:hypothetical protein